MSRSAAGRDVDPGNAKSVGAGETGLAFGDPAAELRKACLGIETIE
jgi:hypothetical protein